MESKVTPDFKLGPHKEQTMKEKGPLGAISGHHFHIPAHVYNDHEEMYPSLSDYHDYEPNLEFDDTEFKHAVVNCEPDVDVEDPANDFLESPVSDGTIEENFEAELGCLNSLTLVDPGLVSQSPGELDDPEDFSDIAQYGIVEVAGDDSYGRKVIVVSSCRLPSNKEMDHNRFLRYLLHTLDQFVEEDYSLVYFHYGLNSKNKPPLSWLWQAYKAFDRKYKKNLKALYLVHPTNFIKVVWQIFKPAISVKFGRKVMYVNYLHELTQHLHLEQVSIPTQVLDHDKQVVAKSNKSVKSLVSISQPLDTQQFGVSLQFIKDHQNGEPIPRIVKDCIEYLEHPDVLETEGLFRRSANTTVVKEYSEKVNKGESVTFTDPHVPAVLLKKFLRELEEPLMTFDLFDEIIEYQMLPKDERPKKVKTLILEKLHEDNYQVLKYIVQFLSKVMDRSDLNKMTSANLAVVFGPNLMWSKDQQMSLAAIGPINQFTDYILSCQDEIFLY